MQKFPFNFWWSLWWMYSHTYTRNWNVNWIFKLHFLCLTWDLSFQFSLFIFTTCIIYQLPKLPQWKMGEKCVVGKNNNSEEIHAKLCNSILFRMRSGEKSVILKFAQNFREDFCRWRQIHFLKCFKSFYAKLSRVCSCCTSFCEIVIITPCKNSSFFLSRFLHPLSEEICSSLHSLKPFYRNVFGTSRRYHSTCESSF